MASSVMSSQSVILTTAMAVSGAVIYLSLSGIKNFPSNHQIFTKLSNSLSSNPSSSSSSSLRSCLSSGEKKRREKNKKKRVKFSDHVKVQTIENNDYNNNGRNYNEKSWQMPPNQAALYQGILRDRIHRF